MKGDDLRDDVSGHIYFLSDVGCNGHVPNVL